LVPPFFFSGCKKTNSQKARIAHLFEIGDRPEYPLFYDHLAGLFINPLYRPNLTTAGFMQVPSPHPARQEVGQ